MTGMKEGAGEDPFADDSGTDTTASEAEADATDEHRTADEGTGVSSGTADGSRPGSVGDRAVRVPYKFRRDGVQDGRDRVPLFVQAETKRAERDALRDLERRFDENVSLTDLREALVTVGLDNLDEVERQLEEWGYGITFEE